MESVQVEIFGQVYSIKARMIPLISVTLPPLLITK
jgi:hypothetical protein